MFDSAPANPPDAIFGLNEDFKRDQRADKINLTVGMYKRDDGVIPIMSSVRKAEQIILDEAKSHVYLPIDGNPKFNQAIPGLVLGESHPVCKEQQAQSAQTPGGTGALRVAGEMLSTRFGVKRIWISKPTWSNHLNIFRSAGLEIAPYHYLDQAGTAFDFERCLEAISQATTGDAILLHTVCHNPTGVDPGPEQWKQIFQVIRERNLIPIFDFAYQGFDLGVTEDTFPIREFCQTPTSALICSSFSKNFNLYGERVGAITAVAPNAADAKAVLSQIKAVIRSIYSNPPMFGSRIVSTVFSDEALKAEWLEELDSYRVRIREMREQFVKSIDDRVPEHSFAHILKQRGMFSYSGIDADTVERLKTEFGIYLLKSGRINVAGINSQNLEPLCDAIATVLTNAKCN